MRVLYLIGGSGRLYGSEMVALNLLKQLSDRVDFIVITSCYGDINKYCEKNKIEYQKTIKELEEIYEV